MQFDLSSYLQECENAPSYNASCQPQYNQPVKEIASGIYPPTAVGSNIPPAQPIGNINLEDNLDISSSGGSANSRALTKTVTDALQQLEQALSNL